MKHLVSLVAALALAACGNDDALADRVEQRADARADALEAKSETADPKTAETLRARAEFEREAANDQATAIREAPPVAPADLTPAEKKRILTGQVPEPAGTNTR